MTITTRDSRQWPTHRAKARKQRTAKVQRRPVTRYQPKKRS